MIASELPRSHPGESALHRHAAALDPRPLAADVDAARLGDYRGYAELADALARLVDRGAAAVRVGDSVRGEPVWMISVGPERAPVATAVLAGIHAMEWVGVEVGLALLARLVADPPDDRRVIAFPLINPDGYRRVEADLRGGARRFRRANARGVDLNRNWPTHFARRHLPSRVFPALGSGGPRPLSEPEVAAVAAALDAAAADATLDVALSLHSIGRKILVPYGGRWRPPVDVDRARLAARAIDARLTTPYTIVQSARWVPGAFAHGMELDHLHARYGATALLVECSLGGARASDPSSWIHPFRWFNPRNRRRVVDELADALEPFVRGHD